jgi:hypothetical protein
MKGIHLLTPGGLPAQPRLSLGEMARMPNRPTLWNWPAMYLFDLVTTEGRLNSAIAGQELTLEIRQKRDCGRNAARTGSALLGGNVIAKSAQPLTEVN